LRHCDTVLAGRSFSLSRQYNLVPKMIIVLLSQEQWVWGFPVHL